MTSIAAATRAEEDPGPRCVPLGTQHQAIGGKASGLVGLIGCGLKVPPGFVVVGAAPGQLPADLEDCYQRVTGGGSVAVRSSAQGEDSASASFAGQYQTLLGVQGVEALAEAVECCLLSARSARVLAYRRERELEGGPRMSVIVQRMVEARAAGVLFTADPVTGRRDRFIVDAVRGAGEALVSGLATPDHYQLSLDGTLLSWDLSGDEPILSVEELQGLCQGAARAVGTLGRPLDLEWAIGLDGELHWLQARPITALPADPRALDTAHHPAHVYTRGNIGECMPGALTPLSLSTVWTANDYGMQRMQERCGLREASVKDFRVTLVHFGHLFIDLHELGRTSTHLCGATDQTLGLAICGRVVDELDTGPRRPLALRLVNTARYLHFLLSGERARKTLERAAVALRIPEETRPAAMFAAIDERLPVLFDAFEHHLASSAGSGALEPALLGALARGGIPTSEHHAELAAMLAACSEHDVESATIVGGIERLVEAIATFPDAAAGFVGVGPDQAWRWLRADAARAALLDAFLEQHGHRCLRELELREKEWRVDPQPLVESLQVAVGARLRGPRAARPVAGPATAAPPRGMGWLVRLAQSGVRRRERTKSLLVTIVTTFKAAYRQLGALLADEGRLPEADAVFFLTHEELGRLVGEPEGDDRWRELVAQRRQALAYQTRLHFPDVFVGSAPPLPPEPPVDGTKVLLGKPVSRGRVVGVARVACSLREAAALEQGEILITPVTDIGWTPYFSIIGGLATDVGSSVSHGAVVAREYGLPAVVDLRVATQVFRTGDRVVLDGDTGTINLATEGDGTSIRLAHAPVGR